MFSFKTIFTLGLSFFITLSCQTVTGPVQVNAYRIVFTSANNGSNDLYSIDLKTLKIVQLTFDGNSTSAYRAPGGKHIYYNSAGDIYRMDTDGSNKINLTHSPATEAEFSVSFDGSKIAFVSDRNKTPNELYRNEIYLMNADGSNQQRISFSKYYSQSPDFSPDNNTIAYVSFDYDSIRFTIHFYTINDSKDTIITPKGASQDWPVFSPDGKYLSYFSRDDQKLNLLDLQTGDVTKLIFGTNQKFSPDGRYFYFISTGLGALDVFKYDIPNGTLQNITRSGVQENGFDISPDGEKIIFSAFPENTFSSYIYIKTVNGNGFERLTNDQSEAFYPIFIW